MTPGRKRKVEDIVLLLTLAAALTASWKFIDYAYDDAYITYRYAKNILHGNGFVYNLEHNYLGTTTPLYTLLLAGLGLLIDIPRASGLVSLTSLLSCIYLLEMIGRHAGLRFVGLQTGLFLMLNPEIYRIFGGETLFVYFLLIPLALHLHQRKHDLLSPFVFGLAILSRMDAGLFVSIFYAHHLLRHRRIPFRQIAVIVLTTLPWFAYALVVFQDPFPSTLAAKMAQGESGGWPLFFAGSAGYLAQLTEYGPGLRPGFLLLLAAGVVRAARRERVWLYFVVNSALFALIYQYVLRASFSHWYLANIYLTNAILLGAGMRQLLEIPSLLAERLRGERPWALPAARWAITLALALLVGLYLFDGARRILDFNTNPPRRQIYTRLGHWLERNTHPTDTVAYFEIGYMGYYSERTIIDPVGLVTPGGLESIEQGDLWWIFRQYEPDYYVHNPHLGRRSLLARPWFRKRYRLVEKLEQQGFAGGLSIFGRR